MSSDMINLDNGNVSPSPKKVTETLVHYTWLLQDNPPFMFDFQQWFLVRTVRKKLAHLCGCDEGEVAIVRNTTEALDTVLLGMELKSGDEILTTNHDYWAMFDALEQRRIRDGIIVNTIDVPVPVISMDQLVEGFEKAITAKTKLILVSHVVNLTGQIFPVKRICEIAHQKGIEVVVDGAHSFAHLDFKVAELGCDYFGTSLHKWLLAPMGTGMLYVQKDKIEKLWSLTPAPQKVKKDISKFEYIGTHSPAATIAIGEAIDFHEMIGAQRKQERFKYLTSYWVDNLKHLSGIHFLTTNEPQMNCGLATFWIEGIDCKALAKYLLEQHSIFVQDVSGASHGSNFKGVRVTPNVYTTTQELDYFCEVMERVSKNGLPK